MSDYNVSIAYDVDSSALKTARREIGGVNNNLKKSASTARKDFGPALVTGAKAAAVAIGSVSAALAALTVATLKNNQAINDAALFTGDTSQNIADLSGALERVGVPLNTTAQLINRVSERLQEASDGSQSFVDLFNRLNLSVDELSNQSPSQLLQGVVVAINNVEDSALRARAANQLLGDSNVNILKLGSSFEELEANIELARASGVVAGKQLREEFADEFDTAVNSLNSSVTSLRNAIAEELAGEGVNLISDFARGVEDNLVDIRIGLADLSDDIDTITEKFFGPEALRNFARGTVATVRLLSRFRSTITDLFEDIDLWTLIKPTPITARNVLQGFRQDIDQLVNDIAQERAIELGVDVDLIVPDAAEIERVLRQEGLTSALDQFADNRREVALVYRQIRQDARDVADSTEDTADSTKDIDENLGSGAAASKELKANIEAIRNALSLQELDTAFAISPQLASASAAIASFNADLNGQITTVDELEAAYELYASQLDSVEKKQREIADVFGRERQVQGILDRFTNADDVIQLEPLKRALAETFSAPQEVLDSLTVDNVEQQLRILISATEDYVSATEMSMETLKQNARFYEDLLNITRQIELIEENKITSQEELNRFLQEEEAIQEQIQRAKESGVSLNREEVEARREQLQLARQERDELLRFKEEYREFVEGISEGFGDVLTNSITDALDTGRFEFDNFLNDLGRMLLQSGLRELMAQIFSPQGDSNQSLFSTAITAIIGGFTGGSGASSGGSAASGAVINAPQNYKGTYMAEQGAEAIMPLGRDSTGRLGVRTSGGGSQQVVYNFNNNVTVNGSDQPEKTAEKTSRALDKLIDRKIRSQMVEQRRAGNMLNAVPNRY